MRPRLRALGDRVLGAPEGALLEVRLRALRWGGPSTRCRAARSLEGEVGALDPLLGALADPAPGVRRAAAWSLSATGSDARLAMALLVAAKRERCDEPRLAMAVAAARCGASVTEAWALVEAGAERTLQTCYGPRSVGLALGGGSGELRRRWVGALCPGHPGQDPRETPVEPLAAARDRARALLDAEPDDRARAEDLAALQDARDLELLSGLQRGAGRRASLAAVVALGLHGDPRALPALRGVLRAVDVDPGAGFAGRFRAATALGRLGLPEAAAALVEALEDEAMDHEGRPGAGLGVQIPVRSALLSALGECGEPEIAPVLATYLANTHGSALGGFHLPAMDALWKLGDPAPLRALLSGPEIAAANALGVLVALGDREAALAHREDRRPLVAEVAARALA